MNHNDTTAGNRRKTQRQYLARHVPVEVVFGQRRIAVEHGWICDISPGGIGLRSPQPIRIPPGTAITLAASVGDKVVTIAGKVASSRHAHEFGIEVESRDAQECLKTVAGEVESVAVAAPEGSRSQLSGKFSMSARHPIQWAIRGGAKRIDLARATEIDSAGLGLLLMLNERHRLTIENCPERICRMVRLARIDQVCAADCPRRR